MPPSEPNGNIQVYQAMVYNEDDPAAIQIHNLSVIKKKDQSVTAMIEGLKGGHTYNVSVRTDTFVGGGEYFFFFDRSVRLVWNFGWIWDFHAKNVSLGAKRGKHEEQAEQWTG